MPKEEKEEKEERIYFRTKLNKSTHKRLKRLALELDRTMESIAEEVIEAWLDKTEAEMADTSKKKKSDHT